MKTNEFFMRELGEFLKTHPLSDKIDTPQGAQDIYNLFCDYYIYDEMRRHVTNEDMRSIIGLQPGCDRYSDVNEDVRDLIEEYLNNVFIDVSDTLFNYYVEKYNNGDFDENDDEDIKNDWPNMSEVEKLEYIQEAFNDAPFNYLQMFGYVIDEFEDIFIEKYINHLLNEAKKILKENPLVYDISSDSYYKDGKVVSDKKTPIKSYIRKYHTTQKKVLDWFREELEYSLVDFATEETLDNEMLINALTNEIENNGYIG